MSARGLTLPTEAKANLIYDILVQQAEASEYWRRQFVQYVTQDDFFPKEFRFQGNLGFGGKIYVEHSGKFRVSQYREDETPDSKRIIAKINLILGDLP